MHCRTIVLASLLFSSLNCLAQKSPAEVGALDDLDTVFVPTYEARLAMLQPKQPTYVEVSGRSLFLHRRGQETVGAVVLTDLYDRLKDVAHAPFTVYLSLVGLDAVEISEAQMKPLRIFAGKLRAAEVALPFAGFDDLQLARQKKVLSASTQIIERTLANRKADQEELRGFVQAMAPLTLQNADEAGCAQVMSTHAQMMRWKPLLTAEEWQALSVVIVSSHQPRYRNVATQYFSWLLQAPSPLWSLPGESSRVVYAETLFPGQTGGNVLLSVDVDFDAGQAFFGDKWRLSEDLLSSGAARCVGQLNAADRTWQQ